MKQEDKELLLKDLCARLPYGVKVSISKGDGELFSIEVGDNSQFIAITNFGSELLDYVKPYLRPMSSMTEKELKMFKQLQVEADEAGTFEGDMLLYDWLNKNHFDYRLLIFQGLALEAPENMYKEI